MHVLFCQYSTISFLSCSDREECLNDVPPVRTAFNEGTYSLGEQGYADWLIMIGHAAAKMVVATLGRQVRKKVLEPLVPEFLSAIRLEILHHSSITFPLLDSFNSQVPFASTLLCQLAKTTVNMLRQGFRRYAGLASAAAPSLMMRSRTAFPVAQKSIASLSRTPATFKNIAYASRLYSSEAAAVEAETVEETIEKMIEKTAPEEVVNFIDLSQAGVHKNLLDAIIKDMGYDSMTPVQSKTINPALKGTDM